MTSLMQSKSFDKHDSITSKSMQSHNKLFICTLKSEKSAFPLNSDQCVAYREYFREA